MKEVLNVLKVVFSEKKNVVIALLVAVFFYSLNVFISELTSLRLEYRSSGFFQSFLFFIERIWKSFGFLELHSVISLVLISLLLGILINLLIYRFKISGIGEKDKDIKKVGFFGSVGAFLGIVVPGCVVCGIGVLPLIGISSSFLLFLPFKGLEISIIAIVLLLFAVYKSANSLINCNIGKTTNLKSV